MIPFPEYHVRGEIRKIVRLFPGPPELLIRIRGDRYDPARPATFVHLRALDVRGVTRSRRLGPGAEVRGLVRLTTGWLEEAEKRRRPLEVNGRGGAGRIPDAIRILGYDVRITGEVLRDLGPDDFVLDAGLPLLVHTPDFPEGSHRVGSHVEFLVKELPEAHLV